MIGRKARIFTSGRNVSCVNLFGKVIRQLKRQSLPENLHTIRRLLDGSSLRFFLRRLFFFRAKRLGQPYLLTTLHELYLVPTTDSVIAPQLFSEGEFDFVKLSRAVKILSYQRLSTLIDVGAHIGSISIPACVRGLADKAIAIEPDIANFRLLQTNVHLNSLSDRVDIIHGAVGPSSETKFLVTEGGSNTGDHRYLPSAFDADLSEVSLVQATALDSLFGRLVPATSILWMDIQGAEGLALEGASRLLRAGISVVLEFDPKMLEPNGGLKRGFGLLRSYGGFFDVNSSKPEFLGIEFLDSFYETALNARSSHDLLFVK